MEFIENDLPGLITIKPKVFKDSRGYFFEVFNQKEFEAQIGKVDFVQDNESKSTFGVLRGLHFQRPPFTQAKLVRCILGRILDVVVDLRVSSPTYGRHFTIELSSEDKCQLFIPRGFAHGFVVLSPEAVFSYKVDNFYSPSHDSGILWNDPNLSINWQLQEEEIILSEKDEKLKPLRSTEIPF
jgi:dTDP-4-dehydrorhamnose 3,5-epimerase